MSVIRFVTQACFWLILTLSPAIVLGLTGAFLSIEVAEFSLFATTMGAFVGLGVGGFWAEYIRTQIGLGYFLHWIINPNHTDFCPAQHIKTQPK
ncbi:hypothetical protein [Shewanella waksmanii]|uniref:hypothetical protein n=1 Tax=Shewanella waksmanii TaxID=213783 RepID=UPI003736E251